MKNRNLSKKPGPFFKCLALDPSEANYEYEERPHFRSYFTPACDAYSLQNCPTFNGAWGGRKGLVCGHRENFCLQGCLTCLHPEGYYNFFN